MSKDVTLKTSVRLEESPQNPSSAGIVHLEITARNGNSDLRNQALNGTLSAINGADFQTQVRNALVNSGLSNGNTAVVDAYRVTGTLNNKVVADVMVEHHRGELHSHDADKTVKNLVNQTIGIGNAQGQGR